MKIRNVSFNKLIIFYVLIFLQSGYTEQSDNIMITPKIYSKMLARKREEHKLFIKHLMKAKYEKNYKMLSLSFEKILEVIKESNTTLNQAGYNPKNGWPSTDERLQTALTLILENVCFSGELILHLPEISNSILKKYKNWQDVFLWGTDFVNEFPHIITEDTVQMLSLFRQEINESERSNDFVNPYRESKGNKEKQIHTKKVKKKNVKGPQLRRSEL